jgi:hypothetical protein
VYDIRQLTITDMTLCGATLRTISAGAESMEEVGNRVVRFLRDQLVDAGTGEKALVLARFFKTHAYDELDEELRECARRALGEAAPSPDMKCLTLLATVGEKEEWNSRKLSKAYKVLPLVSEELVRRSPMISNLVKQFGLEVSDVLEPDPSCLQDLHEKTFNVFLVAETPGSPYIPSQEEFVIPYGVASTLGFGGVLPSGDFFLVVLFSRAPISHKTAEMFKPLALAVKLALLPFDQGAVLA